MKKVTLLSGLLLLCSMMLSAPLSFVPVIKKLPDGSDIQLYVSGDEFFNYLHDAKGLPVKQGADGYYYYLVQTGDIFSFTRIRAGGLDQAKHPEVIPVITPSWVSSKREQHSEEMAGTAISFSELASSKSTALFNNLVIYIRFKDESDFTLQRSSYDTRLNSITESSLRYYYREVSQNKLDIVSYHFPGGDSENITYTDNYARSYYQPYDASVNPGGYKDSNERMAREHGMLARAIVWATDNYKLPENINFDMNSDGKIDNVSFIVKGSPDGWSDLLWPHRWTLYSRTVNIGSLTVSSYTLQFENVSVGTLSHEMFHSLGAPDLYHYDNETVPVGPWDLMGSGKGHPSAWMKYKYGGWIDVIPEIKKSGTYSLKPAGRENGNAFIIRTPYNPDQFFVIEYRKKEGLYEGTLPASGMIIERIDSKHRGNASGPPDEVYVFRRNGTPSYNGTVTSAALPMTGSVDSFNDFTNPYSFLQDGSFAGIDITDIRNMGDSILFTVNIDKPVGLELTPVSDYGMSLSWKSVSHGEFIAAVSDQAETFTPVMGKYYDAGDTIGSSGRIVYRGSFMSYTDTDIEGDKLYYYAVWAVTDTQNNTYSLPAEGARRSGVYTVSMFPYSEGFDDAVLSLPRGWRSSMDNEGWRPDISGNNPAIILLPVSSGENLLYTPGFNLIKDQKYSIRFNYRNIDPSIKESLFLKGGDNRYDGALEQINLFSSRNFSYSGEIFYRAIVKPVFSGTHYFAFKPGGSGKGVAIDNFIVEKVPEATVVLSDPGAFYPNPGSGMITVPAVGKTEITVYRSSGIKVYETSVEGMSEVDLSHLGSGLYIIKFKTAQGVSSHKLIIK